MFGKLSKEQILKAVKGLSEDEFKELLGEIEELKEVTEAPEAEEATQEAEVEAEAEPEEAPTDEEVEPDEEVEEVVEEAPVEEETVEEAEEVTEAEPAVDEVADNNTDEIIKALTDRVNELETRFKDYDEIKAKMDEFVQKQADSFGYKGSIPGSNKSIEEMSADELKKSILHG